MTRVYLGCMVNFPFTPFIFQRVGDKLQTETMCALMDRRLNDGVVPHICRWWLMLPFKGWPHTQIFWATHLIEGASIHHEVSCMSRRLHTAKVVCRQWLGPLEGPFRSLWRVVPGYFEPNNDYKHFKVLLDIFYH